MTVRNGTGWEGTLLLHAADQSGVAGERCVVVEDGRSGAEAARAVGMRALGYAGGLTLRSWLEGVNTVVFTHMVGLPGCLHPEVP